MMLLIICQGTLGFFRAGSKDHDGSCIRLLLYHTMKKSLHVSKLINKNIIIIRSYLLRIHAASYSLSLLKRYVLVSRTILAFSKTSSYSVKSKSSSSRPYKNNPATRMVLNSYGHLGRHAASLKIAFYTFNKLRQVAIVCVSSKQ